MTTDQLSALLSLDPAAVLENDRRQYFGQIAQAADLIAANAVQRPVVLLAGPSGSGKTTTALLIERALRQRGLLTHTLQLDDYFSSLSDEEVALMRQGKLDLEKPTRIDIPFLQAQIDDLLSGREVRLPRYDFMQNRRVDSGRTLRRSANEIVIMEGIHALNPQVTRHSEQTTRIYVSVRTRITTHAGQTLHPSCIRLARRLLRDRTGRGRSLRETIEMRGKVDRGEQAYIMPFKPNAHFSVDSFYSAELSVYRPFLLDDLTDLAPEYPDLALLTQTLRELPDTSADLVPRDSLLREFIGGSELNY